MRIEEIYDGLVEMSGGSAADLGEAGSGGFNGGIEDFFGGFLVELGLLHRVLHPQRRFV